MKQFRTYTFCFIVDPVITYTLASLCELVNVRLVEAQANSLCYKCKHIFGVYYKVLQKLRDPDE